MAENQWYAANGVPPTTGSHGVKVHATNPNGYTRPDEKQSSHIGRNSVVVPRAKDDGSSSGFDAERAGDVIIDPDQPGGGFVVNFDNLKNVEIRKAIADARNGGQHTPESTFAALQRLAATNKPLQKSGAAFEPAGKIARDSSGVPRGYVTPRSTSDGVPVNVAGPVIDTDNDDVQIETRPAVAHKGDDMPHQSQTAQQQLLEALGLLLQNSAPAAKSPQSPPDVEKIPKPEVAVVFHLPGSGTLRTKYHEVVQGEGCIVLVYDTRYDDGVQFAPPEYREQSLRIVVPAQKIDCAVASYGMCFSLGTCDFVVLIPVGTATDAPESGVQSPRLTDMPESSFE